MSLIAWYPLHKDVQDWSPGGNHLVYNNNAGNLASDSSGILGESHSRNTYNTTDYYRATDTIHLGEEFTFACWSLVTQCNPNTANGLVTNHDHATNSGAGITVKYISATDFRLSCNTGTGTARTFHSYYGSTNIYNKWSHLVMRYAAGVITLWVNGLEEFSVSYSMFSKEDYLDLFNWSTSNSQSSAYRPISKLNDVRVYDHGLSTKEIKELYKTKVLQLSFNEHAEYFNNMVLNADFLAGINYSPADDGRDESLHPNRLTVSNWSGGYNGGVPDPTVGYHAQFIDDSVYGPVIKMNNHNSSYGQTGRWLGISCNMNTALSTLNIRVGDEITLSFDIKSDTINYGPHVGIYHKRISNGANTFGASILYTSSLVNSSNINKWVRMSHVITIDSDWDFDINYNIIYVYGHNATEGISYIKNVSASKGAKDSFAPFSPIKETGNAVMDSSGFNHHSNPVVLGIGTGTSVIKGSSSIYTGQSVSGRYNLEIPSFNSLHEWLTVAIWYKNTDIGNVSRAIIGHSTDYLGNNGWALRTGWGDDLRFNVNGNSEVGHYAGFDNQWVMLVISYDSNTGTQKTYRNGVLVNTRIVTATKLGTTANSLVIGGATGHASMAGYIDDVSIFATVLTDQDILDLYTIKGSIDKNNIFYANEMDQLGSWKKVYNHNTTGGFIAWDSETIEHTGTSVDAPLYSRLNEIDQYKTDNYTFMMRWPIEDKYVVFTQSSPFSSANNNKDGFAILSSNLTQATLDGMTSISVSGSTGSTFYDAYNHATNWFWAIGSKVVYATNAIPGAYPEIVSTQHVELYITSEFDGNVDVTKTSVDKLGVANFSDFVELNYTQTAVNYSTWILGGTDAVGWTRNGASGENLIRVDVNPWGDQDVLWSAINNTVSSDSDGGFNGSSVSLDPTKHHRYTIWIRREVTGNGSWYFGCNGGTTENMSGTANTNPYFKATSSLPAGNEWFLVVGYLYAEGTVTATYTDDGVYVVDGNKIIADCTNFRMKAGSTTNSLRSYLYYSTDITTRQHFYRPRIDAMDGNEPSLTDLLTGAEHGPIVYAYGISGAYEDTSARIRKDGTLVVSEIREV